MPHAQLEEAEGEDAGETSAGKADGRRRRRRRGRRRDRERPASASGSAPASDVFEDDFDEAPPEDDEEAAVRIKTEVVQDVLVVTPVATELETEEANEALRLKLHELLERPMPRRVVVNLEFVGRLTRQTIGVLLAHHLRLDRVGGALRICEAHPRIMALLDQVRLTMLVDCFPTLDEAVLAAWTSRSEGDAAAT